MENMDEKYDFDFINQNNSFIENGILKNCKLNSRLDIKGCDVVCGCREEKDMGDDRFIGDGVFYESLNRNDVLEYVRCCANVIGEKCFEHCTALEEVHLYRTKKIKMMAFMGCTKLTTILIPKTVIEIEQGAFDLIPHLEMYFEGGQKQIDALSNGEGEKYFGEGVIAIAAEQDYLSEEIL